MSLAVFLEEFTALVNTIKHYRGCIRCDTALINYETMATTLNAKKKGAHDKLLAMDFLKKAPCSRFGNLLTELDNLYSRGADHSTQKTWWKPMHSWSTTNHPKATFRSHHPTRWTVSKEMEAS